MSRNAPQVRESRWHDRWARFVRGVKRIVTVVSLICIAVLVGLVQLPGQQSGAKYDA